MKNKKHNFTHVFNQANVKSFSFGFMAIFVALLFYACSSEEESKKEEEVVNKSNSRTKRLGADLIEESAISFSEAILVNYGDLDYALNQNLYVGFNQQTMQMLSSAQNENDLKIVFEQAGIANSQEVVNILEAIVQAQQNFIDQNPNFHTLTQEQQMQYLNIGIETAKSTYVSTQPVIPGEGYFTTSCASTFNTTIGRCGTDYGVCAIFAIAGAYAGGIPGLLGAAYCMVTKVNCDGRAKYDYAECLEATDSASGSNYQLTLHCDKDSCWTTYANGKYVKRVE